MASEKKQSVFLVVVVVLALLVFMFFQYQEEIATNLPVLFLVGAILFIMWQAEVVVFLEDYERAVISRFGKVNRVGGPGWTLMLPFIESYVKVDLRTETIDVLPQDVITKDGIELRIDAVIYLRVKSDSQSVINSVIKIGNYKVASKEFVISAIRELCGRLTMGDIISTVGGINEQLQKELGQVSKEWGIDCQEVVIKDVSPPKIVLDAMHQEKASVQKKLARIQLAEAHKGEIDAVKAAAEQLSDKALAYYYIRALEKMSEGKSTKFVFPMELSNLAKSLSGKVSADKNLEDLFREYAPLFATVVGQKPPKEETEKKEKEKKKD